jgi:PAS domain S-box-containing protein
LILVLICAIILTTFAAGLPAYYLLRQALEQQAWQNLSRGLKLTEELILGEKSRLADLALHASQRPTLVGFLRSEDQAGLSAYLEDFQSGVDIDFIEIVDSCGQVLAESPYQVSKFVKTIPVGGFLHAVGTGESQPMIAAAYPVQTLEGTCQPIVLLGTLVDEPYLEQLADKTGFEYSLLFDQDRGISSLGVLPVLSPGQASAAGDRPVLEIGEDSYLTSTFQLREQDQEIVGEVMVHLSIGDSAEANQRALLILVFSTLIIILLISIAGAYFTRRITVPLDELTSAALDSSFGDFETLIRVPSSPYEVSVLAGALEASRAQVVESLGNLSQAKRRLDVIVQSISEGIITTDQDMQVITINHAAENITGWSREDAVGEPIDTLLSLEPGQAEFEVTPPVSTGNHQVVVQDRTGSTKNLRYQVSRLEDNGGYLFTLHDTTEEEATSQMRAYFIANISHEFRTPLSALNASVELILDEISAMSRAEIVELLNSIHYSVTALQTLIDNLLESTSIEAGHFRIRRRKVNLNNVIAEAVRVVDPLLRRRHQRLIVHEPQHLPVASIDPTRITQVLVNLLSNASKYSPMEEEIELRVEWVEGGPLKFSVEDRGPGITDHEGQNLFQRFVRLGEKDGAQYGVGLGLFVVKTIVEEHGGQVGVDNRESGGSIFWFTIPMEGNLS